MFPIVKSTLQFAIPTGAMPRNAMQAGCWGWPSLFWPAPFPDSTYGSTSIGNFLFTPGERWLVHGPSVVGKSALLRAIAGLCPFGHDRISLPGKSRIMFIPQKNYLADGPLREALAFARTLLFKPDILFMDEASSALDSATEAQMYQLIIDRLPECTIVSIAHRTTLEAFHDKHMQVSATVAEAAA